MSRTVLVLNGPNLNLLGTREPEIYGKDTLEEILSDLRVHAAKSDVEIVDFQSNTEGELIGRLHDARGQVDGVIFNPGAFSHYSIALRDRDHRDRAPCHRDASVQHPRARAVPPHVRAGTSLPRRRRRLRPPQLLRRPRCVGAISRVDRLHAASNTSVGDTNRLHGRWGQCREEATTGPSRPRRVGPGRGRPCHRRSHQSRNGGSRRLAG